VGWAPGLPNRDLMILGFWKLSGRPCSLISKGICPDSVVSKMRFRVFLSLFLILAVFPAFAAEPPAKTAASAAILPQQFGGWQLQGPHQTSKDPAVADGANPAVVQEYGFTDFAAGTYVQDDGRKLTVRAARFADASGAYGAFTYYKQPEMVNEKIGDQASSLNNRVLFYRGNVLVEAVFDRLTGMSAAELRELAGDIPLPQGGARNLPALPTYLPKQDYVKNTAKYVMGPVALEKIGSPLAAQLIDFGSGAEVVEGTYHGSSGEGTLLLISYPTPQIATEHFKRIEAAHQPNVSQGAGQAAVVDMGAFAQKRLGPIVAVAAGAISQSEANALLAPLHYDADVTWNENTYFDKKNNVANLLWNVVVLCGALMGITIVAGLAFGGVRVALQRILPQREHVPEDDFIALRIDERAREGGVRASPGSAGS
jgi:uncharacterized protein DUF6599